MTFHPTAQTIGNLTPPLTVANGGTGAVTAAAALTALGAAPASDVAWGPTDQGLLAWNYDGPSAATGGTTAMTPAGTMLTMAVLVRTQISVTNILVLLAANGSVLTSGQCFGALYQGAAGARVGVTADQATNWGAGAPKLVTMPLAGGPFTVTPGVVYVGLWYNGTTGPSFFRTNNTTTLFNAGLADAAARFGTANTGLTTTAPTTLGTITATGALAAYWVALS